MRRRDFLTKTGVGALGAAGLAAPALAQDAGPSGAKVKWRCVSAFPASQQTIHAGAADLARFVLEASGGDFEIEILPPGEIAPRMETDAVAKGTVQLCHTAAHTHVDRDPVFAFGGALPFALNARGMQAWLTEGGGIARLNQFFHAQDLHYMPGGNTGTQMGGWFRREIEVVDDLQGLRLQVSGLGARVLARLGVLPQALDPGDIRAALQKGALDAAEGIGPHDDEAAAYPAVAPFYYYPGWWEGGLALCFFANRAAYEALGSDHRAVLEMAARTVTLDMLARYDARNPAALRRLVGAGAQLRPFSQDIMQASFEAAQQVYAEISAENAAFRTIYESLAAYRNDAFLWQQVAEYTFDTFMMIKQREGRLESL